MSACVVRMLAVTAAIVAAAIDGGPVRSQPGLVPPPAPAPAPSAEAPPVAVGGWRYEKGNQGVHLFHCQTATCGDATSRVSYRLYGPGNPMTLEQFRREQETVVKMLQERGPAGVKITILGVEGDEGTNVPRMFKARRLIVRADDSQEFLISGVLIGAKASVSLISSSHNEKVIDGNYAQFALPLMLLVQTSAGRIIQK